MQFRVTRMRDRGVRISIKELANQESLVGDLVIYESVEESSKHTVRVAALHGANQTSLDMLPPLYDVAIVGMAPLAFSLRGYERIAGRRGTVDVVQEWLVRLP